MSMDIMMKQFHEKKLKARLALTVPRMIEIRMHTQAFLLFFSSGPMMLLLLSIKHTRCLMARDPHIHHLAPPAPRDRVRGLLG